MAVSILAFVVMGSVLEGIPAIVLFGPLLFPIARALGIHDVHYAMVVVTVMPSAEDIWRRKVFGSAGYAAGRGRPRAA